MKPYGFFQGADGNYSSSRLIAFIMIICALAMAFMFLRIGIKHPEVDLMKIALAIGVLYGSIAGSAMLFLFGQKKTENQELENKKQIEGDNKPS